MNKKSKQIKKSIFPWYDSYWLHSFVAAKNLIKTNFPEKYEFFVGSFEVLKTKSNFNAIELKEVISKQKIEEIKREITKIKQEEFEKYEFFEFGRIIKHDLPYFNKLQKDLVEKVSQLCGEEVECSYNFLSLYNNLGILNPHMDAAPAKWTLDICIDQSDVWPIKLSKVLPWPEDFTFSQNWIEAIKRNPENEFKAYNLEPSNGVLFSGLNQWHYRDRIQNSNKTNFCHLIFFHFIPKGTKDLCYPKKWSKLFGIPELDAIVIDM